jgi:hypothetical protein
MDFNTLVDRHFNLKEVENKPEYGIWIGGGVIVLVVGTVVAATVYSWLKYRARNVSFKRQTHVDGSLLKQAAEKEIEKEKKMERSSTTQNGFIGDV